MTQPRIVVDIRKRSDSGIGTYIQNVVPRVVDLNPSCKFLLLVRDIHVEDLKHFKRSNVELVAFDYPPLSISEQFGFLSRRRELCPSVYWVPHVNVPIALSKSPLLVTICDVIQLARPDLVGGFHQRIYVRGMLELIKRRARRIITISHFSSAEIQKYSGISSERIIVSHLGVAASWNSTTSAPPPPHSYILFVGNIKPNKNLQSLVTAFNKISEQLDHHLLVVGEQNNLKTGSMKDLVIPENVRDRIHFTGRVPDKTLKNYLAQATCLVFPSLYEGFGLPPLEAMACGCPVIAASSSSIPEVCGDAAVYFDPRSSNELAHVPVASDTG